MSKLRKATSDQIFAMESDSGSHDLLIIGGPRPYLWLGLSGESGAYVTSFSGNSALRKFRDALTAALRTP